MASITDTISDPVKVLLIGQNGTGKTGSLASLVVAGYNLRIIDTDKGVKPLRSLLTHPNYPYSTQIKKLGIDLSAAVQYVPFSIPLAYRAVQHKEDGKSSMEKILAPTNASAWPKVLELLDEWKDNGESLGKITTWDIKSVLVVDSFSTLAMMAYYFIQQLNGRLGAREDGYDFQRDVGAAQAQLRRLLELLFNDMIRCNVVVISHITTIDNSKGFNQSPEQRARNNEQVDAKGFPSAIGRALSPHMGKYFNDVYICRQSGSGTNVKRSISTVPMDNTSAKNSVWLEREYDVGSGLAEIFAAMRDEKPSPEVLALRPVRSAPTTTGGLMK